MCGKVNGVKTYEQKRYFLWPLRDILGTLNGSDISDNENYPTKFGQKLSFSLFYRFVKGHKEYVYNNKIPHCTCLCELCENAILISEGIEKAVKQVPTTPRSIVEVYSCDDLNKECAMGECNECKVHDLVKSDFIGDISSEELPNSAESSSEEDEKWVKMKCFQWGKNDEGFLSKSKWSSM